MQSRPYDDGLAVLPPAPPENCATVRLPMVRSHTVSDDIDSSGDPARNGGSMAAESKRSDAQSVAAL